MLNALIKFSLSNRFLVLILTVVIMLSGLVVLRTIDIDVFPDLTAPTVTVITEAHGLEAVEVEKLITFQVETALNGSPQVRRIRSASMAGVSVVWVEFDWGTDIYRARQVVSEKLPQIQGRLPSDAEEPLLAPISSIMGEIMIIGLSSETLTPMELNTLATWEIVPRLKTISGVANVLALGGEHKEYQVLASPHKMKYYGVTLKELAEATFEANRNAAGGILNQYGNQYTIKSEGRAYTLQDLENSLVKKLKGAPIRIRDVSRVVVGAADKIGDGSVNGQPAVLLTIFKQPQINTLKLTDKILSTLHSLKLTLPSGLVIHDNVLRQADFVQASVRNLQKTLMEGAFFVSLILLLFLMNWRTTVISLVAIPISLFASILILDMLDYTINTMSLGGMAIAIGALVDDAIIDVENVFKRLRQNHRKNERKSIFLVIFEASVEVRSSIIIATLIIIVSFIPLFFLSGFEGRLLQPLGIAFITSLMASLVVALTLTPVLCSFLLTGNKILDKRPKGTLLEKWLRSGYQILLTQALRVPGRIVITTFLLLILSLIVLSRLGRSFLPDFNEGSLVINVVGPPSMSIYESNRVGTQMEKKLMAYPELGLVARRTGRAETDEHVMGVNSSELDAPFVLNGKSKHQFLTEIRKELSAVSGVDISIGQPVSHRIDHMLSGTRANVVIKIFGPELNQLYQFGNQINQLIQNVPGLVDLRVEQQIEVPQLRIEPNANLLAKYGLTKGELGDFVQTAFLGQSVSQVFEGQRSFDLVVRFEPESRGTFHEIALALIDAPESTKLPLEQLAQIESESTPFSISRENVQRKLVVSGNVSGRDLRGVVSDIRSIVEQSLKLPPGYRLEYGGQVESEERATEILLLASILAIVIIFVLLYYEFKTLQLAVLVMLNLPMALIGGILAVYFTSGIISIASTIGFISLFGIATRNGILLVTRYQNFRKADSEALPLIIEGSLDRIVPITMTALTTALALIPLVVAGGEPGNEIQSPMAAVILGGILTSWLLNVLVIPCAYYIFYDYLSIPDKSRFG